MYLAYAGTAEQALSRLRDTGYFQWYIVPILVICIYIYAVEVERRNWNIVLAGLAFYGLECFLEIGNALWLHTTKYSAVWLTPNHSAYIILAGLTIEISLMFSIMGIVGAKMLPPDKKTKILGLPNRWFMVIALSIACVFVEVILNLWGVLVWNYPWWNWPNVWLIIIIGYSLYWIFSFWIHDMESLKRKIAIVSGVWAVDIILLIVFLGILKWI